VELFPLRYAWQLFQIENTVTLRLLLKSETTTLKSMTVTQYTAMVPHIGLKKGAWLLCVGNPYPYESKKFHVLNLTELLG
jgi:hypothetical protein